MAASSSGQIPMSAGHVKELEDNSGMTGRVATTTEMPCTTVQGLKNDPLARGTKVARVAKALPMSKQQLGKLVVHPLASRASRGAITGARGPR